MMDDPAVDWQFHAQSRYRSSGADRWVGLCGTLALYGICAVLCFVAISTHYAKPVPPAALTVLSVQTPASPEEVPPEEKDAPKPVEKQPVEPRPITPAPMPPVEVAISPVTVPVTVEPVKPADLPSLSIEAAAPKTAPAPPAPRIAGSGPDSWEGRVLAALNQKRRYPRLSLVQRQQGVPWIRFVMDRAGKVVSVRLERASGFTSLDREALALPKRAEPLPKPPEDKAGATFELVVPIEFFLR